jgi:hypothetical protein
VAFTGDSLLVGTVGIQDAPGCDPSAHYDTVQRVFDPLADDVVVHPGHDDMGRSRTTIKAEKRGNRWMREKDRDAFVARYRADPRPVPKESAEILAANREGDANPPPEAIEAAERAVATVASSKGTGALPTGGVLPSGVAQVLLAAGVLVVLGSALAILVNPLIALAPALVGVAAIALGVGSLARARPKGRTTPDFYYTGPAPRGPLR